MTIGILFLLGGLFGAITGQAKMRVAGMLLGYTFDLDPPPHVAVGIYGVIGIALVGWAYVNHWLARNQMTDSLKEIIAHDKELGQ